MPQSRSHSPSRTVKPLPRLTLVLGGARSGKSAHAEAMLATVSAPWLYVATGQAWDDEMRARIAAHRCRRASGWQTVEVPLALGETLDKAAATPALVDCLTLWLTNLLLGGHDVDRAAARLEAALAHRQAPTVLVSNEVGLGIVPENALARRFRDEAGLLHQRLARQADHVVLVTAGLPLVLKQDTV